MKKELIAWYTSHIFSLNVIYNIRRGFKCPTKHVSFFDKEKSIEEPICYGILRGCEEILKWTRQNGSNYWHIDNGYIGGDHSKSTKKALSKKRYYRISKNNTQAAYIDYNYPSDRAKNLMFKLYDWHNNKDGIILILPPTKAVTKYFDLNIDDWLESVKKKIGNKPYKIRTKQNKKTSLEDDLMNTKCLITYNSNASLEAIFYGIPTIIASENSIIKKWNNLDLNDIDLAYQKSINLNRQKLINFASYHQFTLEEMSNGIAYQIIKELDENNLY